MSKKPKTKRRAIGEDPLDAYLSPSVEAASKVSRRGLAPAGTTEPEERGRRSKVRSTFHLPTELVEEARDTVVHLSGPPEHLTMAELGERAIRKELDRLRKKHNDGERFPPRGGPVRTGRPIK